MNILLSGGWGYGNIGDDAILIASLSLLKKQYPDAQITITSYNPEYTREIVGNKYEILPSVHRKIFGKRAFRFLCVQGYVLNTERMPYYFQRLYNYVIRKIKALCYKNKDVLKSAIAKLDWTELQRPFFNADIFIMSGGGYFNNWQESMVSRIIELELAEKSKVKSFICGQTIGPFDTTPEWNERLVHALKTVSRISVRDVASQKDLKNWNIHALLAPDLALSQNPMLREEKGQTIAIVPAELPRQSRNIFIKGMSDFIRKKDLRASVIVTRLYIADIECAKQIYAGIQKLCGKEKIKLVIPRVYCDIEQPLMRSKYVVSRNLHGLILAWRSGAKCLCMNNERKFVTFMQQIECPENVIDIKDMTFELLCRKLENMYLQDLSYDNQYILCKDVVSKFQQLINKV